MHGFTPLHLAALGDHADCIRVLVEEGCSRWTAGLFALYFRKRYGYEPQDLAQSGSVHTPTALCLMNDDLISLVCVILCM